MFSEEFFNYITRGQEQVNLEYKDSMNWRHSIAQLKIIKAMLAMANNKYGGVIVIGVKENINKIGEPVGMNNDDFQSFNYDEVSRVVKCYCDPMIEFSLLPDITVIDNEERKFVVIQITESSDPVICAKFGLLDKSAGHHSDNIELRKNAIYIRSKAPIESREISTIHEWRELIAELVYKSRVELLKKLPCAFILDNKTPLESNRFDDDIIRDNI